MSEPIRNIKVYAKKNGVYEEIKADVDHRFPLKMQSLKNYRQTQKLR